MSIKEKYLYYGMTVLIVVLFIITGLMLLTDKEERNAQIDIESKLPERSKEEEQEQKQEEKKPPKENPMIRVVIKTNGFQQMTHAQVGFQAQNGLIVMAGKERREYNPNEVVTIAPDDSFFQKGTIKIEPKTASDKITVTTLQRGYGTPSYRGHFELITTVEGIVLVNELPMEEYLYAVVPSEMPASYEMEALKTQAVCARSYAYCQMQELSYPEYQAHVDDSTSFQVYGNSKEQASAIRAVDETRGEKLWHHGQVITAYYYSTSCGKSTSIEAWGHALNEQNQYLQSVTVCKEDGNYYEAELPWFRWTAEIPEQTLSNLISLNTKTDIGTLQNITVTRQGAGGVVQQIVAEGTKGQVTVETENKIRRALGGTGYQITKQDGTTVQSQTLLPSAFFTIEKDAGKYILKGGGFGHGIGMSQNGANEMAKAGKHYEEILQFFYSGVSIE